MLLKYEFKLKEPLKWNMKFVYHYFPDNTIEFKLRDYWYLKIYER